MAARFLTLASGGLFLLLLQAADVRSGEMNKLWPRHAVDSTSRGADGVRLADVNGDGLLDISTGWEEGAVIRAYLHPGHAVVKKAWPRVTVGQQRSPEDAVFADLDGDGAFEVISSCEGGTRSVFVHWAPAQTDKYLDEEAWQTEAFPAVSGRQLFMYALPLDVDGRNGIDLVLGSKGSGAAVGWLESPENPREVAAWRYHKLVDAGWIMSLEAHDMDGDGDADVLVSDRKGNRRGVYWLENPGGQATRSGEPWQRHDVGGMDRQVMFLSVGDLDADGRRDVLCAVSGRGESIAWFRNTPGGWSLHEVPVPEGVGTGKSAAVADIDLNGRPDVVFSCENAGGELSGIRWLSCPGSPLEGSWQSHEISGPEGVKYDRLELVDLDGDGDLDVLTCEERAKLGVIWYENPTGTGSAP